MATSTHSGRNNRVKENDISEICDYFHCSLHLFGSVFSVSTRIRVCIHVALCISMQCHSSKNLSGFDNRTLRFTTVDARFRAHTRSLSGGDVAMDVFVDGHEALATD